MKKISKKLLAIFLAVAMLASMMISLNVVSAEETLDIWDGTTAEPVAVGDGVYEISTPEQLAHVISTGGGAGNTYKLTCDIYLNDLSKIDWATGEVAEGYTPNQWYTRGFWECFNGNLDGNGHTVYGLYFIDPNGLDTSDGWPMGAGLVPYMGTGSVKNIGLDSSYIYNYEKYSTAAIVGGGHEVINATIEKCYAGANVTVEGYDVAGIVGGGNTGGTVFVKDCYSLATLNGENSAGGIIGSSWQNDVWTAINCYTIGKATGGDYQIATLTNVYETVDGAGAILVTEDALKGVGAATTLAGFDFTYTWKTTDSYPILRVFTDEVIEEPEYAIWNGFTQAPVNKGEGVYEINNAEQLAYVISTGGGAGNTYNLTCDIYLNDLSKINWATGEVEDGYTPNQWYTKGFWECFNGNLNGNGHTVYGLYFIDPNGEDTSDGWPMGAGLVPYMGTGSVKNIGLDSSYIYNFECYSTAAIVGGGHESINATIEKCYAGANVTVTGYDVAGIVGGGNAPNGTVLVKDCYSLANLSGTRCVGGIIASSWQNDVWTAMNCFTIGKATGGDYQIATLTNVYETVDGAGAILVTEDALKGVGAATTLAGFDFTYTWKITDSYPILRVFTDEIIEIPDYEIWSGNTQAPVDKGNGVYEINNAEQLAYVISTGGGTDNTYNLTCDIYLNDLSKIDWETSEVAEGYTPNTWYTRGFWECFNGNLNGNGHTVYGLYFIDEGSDFSDGWPLGAGLVPYMGEGSVKNIGLDYSYIYNYDMYSTAAIVGGGHKSINATIENCYAGANVAVEGYDVAGIVGGGNTGGTVLVKNCYSLAILNGEHSAGGIIGSSWQNDVWKAENCYTIGKATGGDWQIAALTNVYETVDGAGATLISEEDLLSGDAASLLTGLDYDKTWALTVSYPALRVFNPKILGDANEDASVNVIDLVKIKKLVIAETYLDVADMNKDETVNATDLTLIRKWILGIR